MSVVYRKLSENIINYSNWEGQVKIKEKVVFTEQYLFLLMPSLRLTPVINFLIIFHWSSSSLYLHLLCVYILTTLRSLFPIKLSHYSKCQFCHLDLHTVMTQILLQRKWKWWNKKETVITLLRRITSHFSILHDLGRNK